MYSHLITSETDEKNSILYRIEFKRNNRIIKVVYINGNSPDWSKNLMSEINKFYTVNVPEFEQKMKRILK